MYSILLVDDDPNIRELIGLYFRANGFAILEAENGDKAITLFQTNKIDLILLDIMMPGEDGISICKRLREYSKIPIVFLTALTTDVKALDAYDAGCDDYIVKGTDPKLIVAKVKRIFERLVHNEQVITIGDLCINENAVEVWIGPTRINLTYKEFQMLLLFAKNPNHCFPREIILEQVWGYDYTDDTRIVDTHIKNLRKKLGEYGQIIKTVFSMGYKLEY